MGWLQEKPTVSNRVSSVIGIAALTIPLFFTLRTVFMILGWNHAERGIFGLLETSVLVFLWLGISLYQYMTVQRHQSTILFHFFLYYVIATFFILFTSGYEAPTTYTYIILALASYIYFGKRGLTASITYLALIGIADALLDGDFIRAIQANVMAFGAISIITLIVVMTMKRERVDQAELDQSLRDLSEHSSRLRALINNLTSAVISVNNKGRITSYNAATLSLLDTNEELEHQAIDNVVQLYASGDKPVSLKGLLGKATTVVQRDDLYLKYGDDRIRLDINISPVRGAFMSENSKGKQELGGYILLMTDITKQKSLEEEKDEFISVVSHELRTPITIAEGTIDNVLIMLGRDNVDKKVLQTSIKMAHEQVIFLAKMVNDLSTLSRAERGVADAPEIMDVNQLMQELFVQYEPQAREKGLSLDLDTHGKLGKVKASPLYLKELLQNFITNAIKYTKEGSIKISAKLETNGDITFAVKDSGIGISKTDIDHIFEKFYRSEDYRTRETGGTGLGLYVSQKLAKKIGTWINVTSKLNHGSTFSISIPTVKETDDAETVDETVKVK